MRHVFIPAALILATAGAGQVTPQAQGMGGEGANFMHIDGTGRPGAVDV